MAKVKRRDLLKAGAALAAAVEPVVVPAAGAGAAPAAFCPRSACGRWRTAKASISAIAVARAAVSPASQTLLKDHCTKETQGSACQSADVKR